VNGERCMLSTVSTSKTDPLTITNLYSQIAYSPRPLLHIVADTPLVPHWHRDGVQFDGSTQSRVPSRHWPARSNGWTLA